MKFTTYNQLLAITPNANLGVVCLFNTNRILTYGWNPEGNPNGKVNMGMALGEEEEGPFII